ncbi:hypothetical protein GW17_00030864 [Ensete ventricosum]|nr:hypothetical protein GW17_00030864 [Ensete ventricosum]RZS14958.1 hypothetical protein BHM03_00046723 [Ensete ventricosum]
MVSEPRIVLRIHSKNSEEGRLARASPHAGLTTHGQVGCKGQSAAAKAPCKGAAGHDQNPLAGAVANKRGCPWAWLAPAGVGSTRGQAVGRCCQLQGRKGQPRGQGCRLQGRPPVGATPA